LGLAIGSVGGPFLRSNEAGAGRRRALGRPDADATRIARRKRPARARPRRRPRRGRCRGPAFSHRRDLVRRWDARCRRLLRAVGLPHHDHARGRASTVRGAATRSLSTNDGPGGCCRPCSSWCSVSPPTPFGSPGTTCAAAFEATPCPRSVTCPTGGSFSPTRATSCTSARCHPCCTRGPSRSRSSSTWRGRSWRCLSCDAAPLASSRWWPGSAPSGRSRSHRASTTRERARPASTTGPTPAPRRSWSGRAWARWALGGATRTGARLGSRSERPIVPSPPRGRLVPSSSCGPSTA